eukprot:946571-Prymnesium_polylepis.1
MAPGGWRLRLGVLVRHRRMHVESSMGSARVPQRLDCAFCRVSCYECALVRPHARRVLLLAHAVAWGCGWVGWMGGDSTLYILITVQRYRLQTEVYRLRRAL